MHKKAGKSPSEVNFFAENGESKQKKGYFCSDFT
jgi:hypothetical protein